MATHMKQNELSTMGRIPTAAAPTAAPTEAQGGGGPLCVAYSPSTTGVFPKGETNAEGCAGYDIDMGACESKAECRWQDSQPEGGGPETEMILGTSCATHCTLFRADQFEIKKFCLEIFTVSLG